MRSRPDLEVRISSKLHPGDTLRVDVTLLSRSRTPVEFVHVDLICDALTPGPESPTVTSKLHSRAELSGATELGEGTYPYKAAFPLPADGPPSYVGSTITSRYRVVVHVSIPWWPDVKETFDVKVAPRPVPRPPRVPVVTTSLRHNEPFVEVSLDDSAFAPGDIIGGSLAFGNVERARVQDVELSLVGFEDDRISGRPVREGQRYTAVRALDGVAEGREIPIRFEIPRNVVASFGTRQLGLGWAFEVQLGLKGVAAITHRVPITLARFDQPAAPGPMRQRVGAGRWHSVWARVGRDFGLSLGDGDLELTGGIDGADVTVRTSVSEGHGELTAELRWDPWGLGLSIGARRLLDTGIELDEPAFDRRFRVRGRDVDQVRATLGPGLRRALLAFDDAYLDDEHATVRSSSPGHDQPWIGAFIGKVAALAAALRAGAEQIPPPVAMAAMLPAWRAFAADHGGKLRVGAMRVADLVIDGARFEVETMFGRHGDPEGSLVRLIVDPPLPPQSDSWRRDLVALGANHTALALIAALRPSSLHMEEQAMTVQLELLADPGTARGTLDQMLALVAALRGDRRAGPYR